MEDDCFMTDFGKYLPCTVALAATLFASACATSPDSHTGHGDIQVVDPWIRATPPTAESSAAYMQLINSGDATDRLVSASGDAAESVELHTHVLDDGMLSMEPIDVIDVPADGETVLEPRGLHVMLVGLTDSLEDGDTVPLELTFEHAGTMMVDVPVRRDASTGDGMDHDAMDHEAIDKDDMTEMPEQDAMDPEEMSDMPEHDAMDEAPE